MPTMATAHIHLDDRGVAWIDDTNVKVIEVVLDKLVHGWSPEKIHFQHLHLSLAQIHAALSYYYDHQNEFDAEIERQLQEVEASEGAQKERLRLAKELLAEVEDVEDDAQGEFDAAATIRRMRDERMAQICRRGV